MKYRHRRSAIYDSGRYGKKNNKSARLHRRERKHSAEHTFKTKSAYGNQRRVCRFILCLGRTSFLPALSPEDAIDLPERVLNDVMPYGAAAFLAQSENDGDQQQYYIMLYNQKRAALTTVDRVTDSMPTAE